MLKATESSVICKTTYASKVYIPKGVCLYVSARVRHSGSHAGRHITLYTSFKKRQGLVNLTEKGEGETNYRRRELRSSSTTLQDNIHYSTSHTLSFVKPLLLPSMSYIYIYNFFDIHIYIYINFLTYIYIYI